MARQLEVLSLTGVGALIQMSTAVNVSSALSAGVYAVWATSQAGYITTGAPLSTTLTAALGYPVVGAAAPILVNVPQSGQIGVISTSSGAFLYEKVG